MVSEKYQKDPEDFHPTFKPNTSASQASFNFLNGEETPNSILNYYLNKGMLP